MLNSLLATMNASQRLWERSRTGENAVISIPMSAIRFSQSQTGLESDQSRAKNEGQNIAESKAYNFEERKL